MELPSELVEEILPLLDWKSVLLVSLSSKLFSKRAWDVQTHFIVGFPYSTAANRDGRQLLLHSGLLDKLSHLQHIILVEEAFKYIYAVDGDRTIDVVMNLIQRNMKHLQTLIFSENITKILSNLPADILPLRSLRTTSVGDSDAQINATFSKLGNLRYLDVHSPFEKAQNAAFLGAVAAHCPLLEVLVISTLPHDPTVLEPMKNLKLLKHGSPSDLESVGNASELLRFASDFLVGPKHALNAAVFPNKTPPSSKSLLTLLVERGDLEGVEMLLQAGADVNFSHPFIQADSPLSVAFSHDNIDMLKLLVRYGADLTSRDSSRGIAVSAFQLSVFRAAPRCVKYLVSEDTISLCRTKDPTMSFLRNSFGETLLHEAVSSPDSNEETVAHLLENLNLLGINVNEQDYHLNTPLHCSISSEKVLDLLIQHEVNCNALNLDGMSPILFQEKSMVTRFLNIPSLQLNSSLVPQWTVRGANLAAHVLISSGLAAFQKFIMPHLKPENVIRVVPDHDCDIVTFLLADAKEFERNHGDGSTFEALKFLFEAFPFLLQRMNTPCHWIKRAVRSSTDYNLFILPGGCAIHFAALNFVTKQTLDLLLQHGADPNVVCEFPIASQTCATALSILCHNDNQNETLVDLMNVLVQHHGARLHAEYKAGQHSLMRPITSVLLSLNRNREIPVATDTISLLLQSYEQPLAAELDQAFPRVLPAEVFTAALDAIMRVLAASSRNSSFATPRAAIEEFCCVFVRMIMAHYKRQNHKFSLPVAKAAAIILAGSAKVLRVFAVEEKAASVAESLLDLLVSDRVRQNEAAELLSVLIEALAPFKSAVQKSMRPTLRRALISSSAWQDQSFSTLLRTVYSVDLSSPEDLGTVDCAVS